jgi:hypothetical protein
MLMPVLEETGQPASLDSDFTDNIVENECLVRQPIPSSYVFHKPNSTHSFHKELVDRNAMKAASILVIRASLQRKCNPAGRTDDAVPPSNILLFLYLSKLVIGIGQFQEKNLSKVMKIIFPYVRRVENGWLPIPTTVSGFRSTITNTSNSNSLVSILPIPRPATMSDGHGYTPFRQILAHALLMESFPESCLKDTKYESIILSHKFQFFLSTIKRSSSSSASTQLAVGLLLWTDGWDPSTSSKSNRSPMHTGTVTMIIVNVQTQALVGVTTYPNMGGPGKIDHGPVCQRFLEDLSEFEREDSSRLFDSRYHAGKVEVYTNLLFIIQDQPERRQASCLLAGNSILHPLFGMSSNFKNLVRPFNACKDCQTKVLDYIKEGNWLFPPVQNHCPNCVSWNVDNLYACKYTVSYPMPEALLESSPGYSLFQGPGQISSSLLIAGWNYAIDMFVHQKKWIQADVQKYLHQMCVNDGTIEAFLLSCRKNVLLQEVKNNESEYEPEEIARTISQACARPEEFELPKPPAMWQLGETESKVEGIMHLSMGIQKAVFKFVHFWATKHQNGKVLQRRLAVLLVSVQKLNISYVPCRPYKDEKFGGYTAETYRAMCMICTWLYTCLQEDDLVPSDPPIPNDNIPQSSWRKKDNLAWMEMRGIEYAASISASEAKREVSRYMERSGCPPPAIFDMQPQIQTEEMRDLLGRMFRMFRAIFSTDLFKTISK